MQMATRIMLAFVTTTIGALHSCRADVGRVPESSRSASGEARSLGILVTMRPVPSGGMARIGSYMPWSIILSPDRPAGLKETPDDLIAPEFGSFEFGPLEHDRRVYVIVDEPVDGPSRLFVDVNRNGDLTDDPTVGWRAETAGEHEGQPIVKYEGGATIDLGPSDRPFPARVAFNRFARETRERLELHDQLRYYRDYAWEGEIRFGDRIIPAMLDDQCVLGDFRDDPASPDWCVTLLLDVNANGEWDSRGEEFPIKEPFNIDGITYEVTDMAADGSGFRLIRSDRHVEEIPPSPDQRPGRAVMRFEATTMAGDAVRFPDDYTGRLVMLELWAVWCGPCIENVPSLVEVYERFHDRGWDILGVTSDSAEDRARVEAFLAENKMTWPQILDGGGWDGPLFELFHPRGIPIAYLVDGDTGIILATGKDLRGEQLAKTIERELEKKERRRQPDEDNGSR